MELEEFRAMMRFPEEFLVRSKIIERVWNEVEGRYIDTRFTDDFIKYYTSDKIKSVASLVLRDYNNRTQWIADREVTDSGVEKITVGTMAKIDDTPEDKQRAINTAIIKNVIHHYLIDNNMDIPTDKRIFDDIVICARIKMELDPKIGGFYRLKEIKDDR